MANYTEMIRKSLETFTNDLRKSKTQRDKQLANKRHKERIRYWTNKEATNIASDISKGTPFDKNRFERDNVFKNEMFWKALPAVQKGVSAKNRVFGEDLTTATLAELKMSGKPVTVVIIDEINGTQKTHKAKTGDFNVKQDFAIDLELRMLMSKAKQNQSKFGGYPTVTTDIIFDNKTNNFFYIVKLDKQNEQRKKRKGKR